MKESNNAARRVPPKNHRPRLFRPGIAVDACGLRSTLDAYEVEELACHELARFLPTIALGEEDQQELENAISDRV